MEWEIDLEWNVYDSELQGDAHHYGAVAVINICPVSKKKKYRDANTTWCSQVLMGTRSCFTKQIVKLVHVGPHYFSMGIFQTGLIWTLYWNYITSDIPQDSPVLFKSLPQKNHEAGLCNVAFDLIFSSIVFTSSLGPEGSLLQIPQSVQHSFSAVTFQCHLISVPCVIRINPYSHKEGLPT